MHFYTVFSLSLHVRVLRCSAVEAFDAPRASLHVPVVCLSPFPFHARRASLRVRVRHCMFVSFAAPPLRPSTRDVRRCMFLSFAARSCFWLALVTQSHNHRCVVLARIACVSRAFSIIQILHAFMQGTRFDLQEMIGRFLGGASGMHFYTLFTCFSCSTHVLTH